MDKRIAHGPWYLVVDLADNDRCLLHGVLGHIHGHAKTRVAGLVRRSDLDESDVDADRPRFDKLRYARETAGNHIHGTGGDGLARQPTGKKRLETVFMVTQGVPEGNGIPETHDLNQFEVR